MTTIDNKVNKDIYRKIGIMLNENVMNNPQHATLQNINVLCLLLGAYMCMMEKDKKEEVINQLNSIANQKNLKEMMMKERRMKSN